MPDELSDFFEGVLVDAFIKFINKQNSSHFVFHCRPDTVERNLPAADFMYIDEEENKILNIELGRLIGMDLGENAKIKSIYGSVKRKLEGNITGSYMIIVDSEKDTISRLPRGGERNDLIQNVIDKIIQYHNEMRLQDKIDIGEGLTLIKYSEKKSLVGIVPFTQFYSTREEQKGLLNIINETKVKFSNIKDPCSVNILIILDTSSIYHEITYLLEFPDAVIPGGKFQLGQALDLGNIQEIYEIDLNTDWDRVPIGLSQCCSDKWSRNWCNHSEIFNNQGKYRVAYFHYFMGSRI